MRPILFAAAAFAIALITACGQKGPLVLPEDQSTTPAHEHSGQAEPLPGTQE